MNLTEEVIYDILMNSDIHDIINLCGVNTQFNKICHDKHFWVNKFNHDQLPVKGGSSIPVKSGSLISFDVKEDWIDAYITAMVTKLINYMKNQNIIYQNLTFEIPLIKLLMLDPVTFSLVKDDLFITKTDEKIKLSYNKLQDSWFLTQPSKFPKYIDNTLAIAYLKTMIYLNKDIKYSVEGRLAQSYKNLII